jgi:hypothetical protein
MTGWGARWMHCNPMTDRTGERKGRPYLILKVYALEIASLLI